MTDSFQVLATDKVAAEGLAPFEGGQFEIMLEESGSDGFFAALGSSQGLIIRSTTTVDRAMLDRAPELKAIGRAGVGVDNIDIDAASERGIGVFNSPGGSTIAATEMTMAMILAVVRNVAASDRSIREGRWDRSAFKGHELKGKTLGLLGAGRIGSEVAVRCGAFGMHTIAFDPYLPAERAAELGIELVDMDEVIERGDVISLHVPLNDETRGMVSESVLQRMKQSAYVVNVSRGGVIDEQALAGALVSGSIAGAGLDVYEDEPLSERSPLRDAPNLVLTPHLGASTEEAQVSVATEVAAAIRTALETGDLSGALNSAQLTS